MRNGNYFHILSLTKSSFLVMGPTNNKKDNQVKSVDKVGGNIETPRTRRIIKRKQELQKESRNTKKSNSKKKKLYNYSDNPSDSSHESDKKMSATNIYFNNSDKDSNNSVHSLEEASSNDDSVDIAKTFNKTKKYNSTSDTTDKQKNKKYTIQNDNNMQEMNLSTFESNLAKSSIVQSILHSQKVIFEKLDIILKNQSTPSMFSADKNITVVKLSPEQKSLISQYMRNKFPKIKFLREAEWTQLGETLLDDIYQKLCVLNDTDKHSLTASIRSYANACINQKRAEEIRFITSHN
jgi:hypothetical protein